MVNLPFSPVDAAIIALIGVAVWNGYRTGFVATLYGLATWIVSFAAAVVFQAQAAQLVQYLGLSPAASRPVAFRAALNEPAFAAAWAEGHALAREEAVALALGEASRG